MLHLDNWLFIVHKITHCNFFVSYCVPAFLLFLLHPQVKVADADVLPSGLKVVDTALSEFLCKEIKKQVKPHRDSNHGSAYLSFCLSIQIKQNNKQWYHCREWQKKWNGTIVKNVQGLISKTVLCLTPYRDKQTKIKM